MNARTAVLPAFRRAAWHTSADTLRLPGPPAELALVPEVVAAADRRWWEAEALAHEAEFRPADRRRLLVRALDLFTDGTVTIGGSLVQGPAEFRAAMWATAGVPAALVDRWCGLLREAVPDAGVPDDALSLVSLPGNTFSCLESVLSEAARSAAVWVRPSRREPFSAARLVAALLAVGWPAWRLGLYPTERRTLRGLVRLTDRQIVYGGADLAASVRGAPRLTVHGPGRGCALVPPGTSVPEAVAWLLPLVAGDGGRFCGNVRTVVCPGPGADALAVALAEALDALPTGPAAPWPLTACRPPGEAERAARGVRERLRPGDRLLTRRPPTARTGAAGSDVYALPALALLASDDPGHPLVGHEVPFPFAAVVPASPAGAEAIAAGSLFVHRPPEGPA
ncbi:hypothetical protein ACH4U6_10105 [Streptomyces netropsis]|uniref:hypothetical protein n=1 Tax=Streptomyces netropsis TaxID=55404 RepID=UPI0037B9D667